MKEDGCKKDGQRAAAELFVCVGAESARSAAKGSLGLWAMIGSIRGLTRLVSGAGCGCIPYLMVLDMW